MLQQNRTSRVEKQCSDNDQHGVAVSTSKFPQFVDSRDKQTTYSNQSWSQTDDLQLARATVLITGSSVQKEKRKSNQIRSRAIGLIGNLRGATKPRVVKRRK